MGVHDAASRRRIDRPAVPEGRVVAVVRTLGRVLRVGIALVAASLTVATAQTDWADPGRRAELEVAAFPVVANEFGEVTSDDPWRELFMEAFDAAVASKAQQPSDRQYPDDFEICAYLVGTGGNPRVDGGGDLLAVAPAFVAAAQSSPVDRSAYRIAAGPSSGTTLYVIDDFHIESLFTSLSVRLSEDVISVDEVDGFQDLWRAFVGYVLDLAAKSDVEVAIHHGHLVAFHALARMPVGATIHDVERRSAHGADRLVLTMRVGASPPFEVHLVDIDFDDLEGIGEAMRTVESPPEDSVHVVNMSWGLVDCALARAYEVDGAAASGAPSAFTSLTAYLSAAIEESPEFLEKVAELCDQLKSELMGSLGLTDPDQLPCGDSRVLASLGTAAVVADVSSRARSTLADSVASDVTYFVAAGNQGLAFPMPPAGWPGFLGVEACTSGVPGRADFSNAGSPVGPDDGTVRVLGAWFDVGLEAIDEASGSPLGPLGYWGTSFAAPTAAMHYAFGALDLEAGAPLEPCE